MPATHLFQPERASAGPAQLAHPLTIWCFGDAEGRFPVFDAGSSEAAPGRWNEAPTPLIYAAEHFATAMLEKLAHCGRDKPSGQKAVMATVPAGCSIETLKAASLPGWKDDEALTRAYGARWVRDARSLLLVVPSRVAPAERNVLVNPAHPEFGRIDVGPEEPVEWDGRLFG
jgi:RES domain-containing protein